MIDIGINYFYIYTLIVIISKYYLLFYLNWWNFRKLGKDGLETLVFKLSETKGSFLNHLRGGIIYEGKKKQKVQSLQLHVHHVLGHIDNLFPFQILCWRHGDFA